MDNPNKSIDAGVRDPLKALNSIAKRWDLSERDMACILGYKNNLDGYRHRISDTTKEFEEDFRERAKVFLETYFIVQSLFRDKHAESKWLRKKAADLEGI